MTEQDKALFTMEFGTLCHTLFKPDETLNNMFIDGKTAKDLFAELSGNLDRIGRIVYKEEWEALKRNIEKP